MKQLTKKTDKLEKKLEKNTGREKKRKNEQYLKIKQQIHIFVTEK